MDSLASGSMSLHGGAGSSVPLHRGPIALLPDHLLSLGRRWLILIDSGLPTSQRPTVNHPHLQVLEWPGGETCKTRDQKARLEDLWFSFSQEFSFDATCGLCAVGGGALLDLVGYTASGLLRGLPLFLVPTTLLAMVDASVGSKNGINHSAGKNLLGTLYDPEGIWLDVNLVPQLPLELLRQGVAEMIKHALLGARHQLPVLTRLGHGLSTAAAPQTHEGSCDNRRELADLVLDNLLVKERIVARSCTHPEWRHALNAGHTLAHAWEACSHYQIPHGDAVGAGLWVEACLAHQMGRIGEETLTALHQALEAWDFQVPSFPWKQLRPYLMLDKKNEGGALRLALPWEEPSGSSAFQRTPVDPDILYQVLCACQPAPV